MAAGSNCVSSPARYSLACAEGSASASSAVNSDFGLKLPNSHNDTSAASLAL
ncbi:hypothetical protein D3C72_2391280 [compost metagenome]